jgi:TFIIF-interacting CTD phosphatase-like protein
VLRIIDEEGTLFTTELYKDDCLKLSEGNYIKDLRIFNDVSRTILLDSSLIGFGLNLNNGILIKPFKGEEMDNSLLYLMSYLVAIRDSSDFRTLLQSKFRIENLLQAYENKQTK